MKIELNDKFPPRPYQQECVNATKNNNIGLIHAPTGSGKTNIMAYIIGELQLRTLIIVPAVDLVEQTKNRFVAMFGSDDQIGAIDGETRNKKAQTQKDILISTWQSLKRKDLLDNVKGKYDMLIIDECHHSSASVLSNIISNLKPYCKNLYGVSATPYRSQESDNAKMLSLFGGKILHQVSVEELYEQNFLVRPHINIIKTFNYGLNQLATENFMKNSLLKKIKESSSYNDFVVKLTAPMYFTIDKLLSQSKYASYQIFKDTPNGAIKPITSYDVTTIRNTFANALKEIEDENIRKMELAKQIMLDFKFGSLFPSYFSSKSERDMLNYARRLCELYANDFLGKNPASLPSNWENIGMKVGFLKKSIDNDYSRQVSVLNTTMTDLSKKSNVKALVLTNTIEFAKKAYKILNKNFKMPILYLDGSSIDKQDTFEAIRKASNDKNFILVSTTSLIKEGIDLPSINLVYSLSPVFNPINSIYSLEQLIGRAIRPSNSKEKSEIVIFDAFTRDFSNRRDEILSIISDNLHPICINTYENGKDYLANLNNRNFIQNEADLFNSRTIKNH